MSKIDKIKKLSVLFDNYKELLTDIQKDIFIQYYQEDSSLAEIAEVQGVSRTAISDNLKKTEEKLLKYESKLNLVKRNEKINKLLDSDKQIDIKMIKELL